MSLQGRFQSAESQFLGLYDNMLQKPTGVIPDVGLRSDVLTSMPGPILTFPLVVFDRCWLDDNHDATHTVCLVFNPQQNAPSHTGKTSGGMQ